MVISSGKVYYDLLAERDARGLDDVYPAAAGTDLPGAHHGADGRTVALPNADIVWCQEEPKNQGAWSFIEPELEVLLTKVRGTTTRASYAGRKATASPATGLASRHKAEQTALVDAALTIA